MSEQAVLHGSPVPQVRRLEVPRRRRRILPFSRAHAFLFPLTVLMLFPLYWIFVTSLMSLSEAQKYPPVFWPHHLLWRNYATTWHDAPFGLYLLNTAFVSVAVVVLNLVFCSLAGYAFARIRFRGRNTVFFALLLTVMVPSQVTIIPTFIIVRWMGQHISPFVGINSLGALIVPYAIDVFGIFMLRQFFLSLPVELEEAAMIDGTSRIGILFKIVLPLSLPALATLGALEFLNVWNDFLWPLVVIQSANHYTVQLGLANFQGIHTTDWNLLMAGNVISLLPMIGVFFLAQRYFIRSVATAGLKG